MRLFSRIFLLASIMYAFGVLLLVAQGQETIVKANLTNSNVVISQIQLSGEFADDEFVELYNPTDTAIDLTDWRLARKTATFSATPQNLVSSITGSIAPRSYFLITPNDIPASQSADEVYSTGTNLAGDNTIILYSDAGQTVVDKVGLGLAADNETVAFPDNPGANESIVRKATETSTEESLSAGGSEGTFGNSYDTDNNAADFVLFSESMPRNSESPAAETMPTVTPTTEPTAVPSDEPTPTDTPTDTPTRTPTDIPTPTIEPTAIPTEELTPTIEPTITVTPTPTMTPSPTPEVIVDSPFTNNRRFVCVQTSRTFSIFGRQFSIPRISCDVIRI